MANGDFQISSIIETSKCMGSEKITERRKSAETLDILLSNQNYISVLDDNTDASHGFTWNNVFDAAIAYMSKEVEKFKQDEAKGKVLSQAQKTLRENHLKLSASSLLNVIVLAGERKPRLDVDIVLHHCLTALKDPFMLEKFGRDHLTALNREILSKRGYWSKLKPNSWLSIFLMSLKILRSHIPNNVTYVSIASLLNYVMHHGTLQSDISLKVRKKLQFFIDNLNNKAMLQKEHHLIKIWIDSAIQLAFSVGSEDRFLLCQLTETTLNTFLDLCHDHLEDIELIVQFSILAMVAHHPCGVEANEIGFMVAGSPDDWLRTMRRLHSLIDFVVKTNNQRNRTAEKKVFELEPNTITLAVRVARQIFSSSDLTMDVTRMGIMDETSTSQISGPSAKKKRLMSGLSELTERLRTMGATSESIPLLQITTHLVLIYPDFPQTHEMKELLDYVVDVLVTHDCRQYEMMSHCFKLFRIVCISLFERRQDSKELLQSSLQLDNVSKLWESIWKCVVAHQCHQESFLLIATLLLYRIASEPMARQIAQVLGRPGGSVPCDRHSMLCLAAFLHRYTLPDQGFVQPSESKDRNSPSFNWNGLGDPVGDRSIRSLLTEWLLNCKSKEYGTSTANLHFRLLAALAMKQPIVQNIDIPSHLVQLSAPIQFDSECHRLESKFRFVELLDQTNLLELSKPITSRPLACCPMSSTILVDQLCLMNDLCVRMALNLENYKKITSEMLSALNDAICFLSLVRNVVLSGLLSDTSKLRENALPLLKSVCCLVLSEDSVYSRQCLQLFTTLLDIELAGQAGEDFLRRAIWDLCFSKLVNASSRAESRDDTFGEIRRGGASHPSVQIADQTQEEKRTSLFDSCILTDGEAWQVDFYRLLSTVSSPVDHSEAIRPDYGAMKTDLMHALSNAGTDPTSYYHLQLGFCLLRTYIRAPLEALDAILVMDLVDLMSGIGLQFIYDYESAEAVLHLLPQLTAHVSNVGCSSSKAKIISLFLRFQTDIQDEMFGPPVEEAFYRCLANLSPSANWLKWGAGTIEATGISPICFEALAGLNRPFNSTVIATCQAVQQLFDYGNITSTSWQDSLLAALSSSIVTKELTAVDEQRDVTTRSASILQLLSSIIVKSPWAEKTTLVMMLRFARYHSIETETVRRALELAARQLNLDCYAWLDSRLEFLLDRWFETEELENFPFGIYHCSNLTSFLDKHQNVIVPIVFLKKDSQKISNLADLMGLNVADLLCHHLAAIVAKILPRLSEAKLKGSETPVTLNRFAQTKYQEIQQLIQDKSRISQALKNNLLELVIRLLCSVHDSNVAAQLFGPEIVLPLTGSFRFEKSAVIEAIRHFSPDVIADANVEPFEHLALWTATNPWEVHTLLVELFVAYETGCRLTDKQQALVNLAIASDLLVNSTEENQQTMLYYVFYSLVHRMGHIIRQEKTDETLRRGALIIVKGIIVKVMNTCPDIVAQLLVTIVGFVTPLAKASGRLQWLAIEILEYLIVEHRKEIGNSTDQLSPFPNLEQFAHLSRALEESKQNRNRTLDEEIGVFLGLVDQLDHDNIPVESVENLAKLLANRKKEVMQLYAQLENRNSSSSDCIRSSLHRLICSLIQLGKTKPILAEAVAAALGELGPSDLTTLILQPDTPVPDTTTIQGQMENHAQGSSTLHLAVTIFPMLVRYLFTDECPLLSVSGRVMQAAMDSAEGQNFVQLSKKYSWPLRNLLIPFRSKTPKEKKSLFMDTQYFDNNIDDLLWTQAGHSWIIRLTCTMIGSFRTPNFFANLLPVCRLQSDFCSVLLPFVVRAMLSCGEERIRDVLSTHINSVLAGPYKMAEPSVKTVLQVVQHLRSQKSDKKTNSPWERNFRLALNYYDVARASQSCSAYFSTIMYAEIWLDRLNIIGHSEPLSDAGVSGYRKMHPVEDLLFEAYTCTGEPDGRTGFQCLPDIRRYEQESDWFRALEFYDAQGSYTDSEDQQMLTFSALSRCGLYRTLSDVTSNHDSPAVKEYQYECAWRLSNWSQHRETDMEEKPGFQQLLFNSLVALKQGDQAELVHSVSQSRSLVIEKLCQAGSLESCRIIYPSLTLLRMVCDVEDIDQCDKKLSSLQEKWAQDRLPVSDFSYLEPILTLRAVMLKELFPRSSETRTALVNTLLETCRKARQYGNYPVAGRCLSQLSTLPDLSRDLKMKFSLEKALTEWQRKDGDRALNTLRSLATVLKDDTIPHPIYPTVLNLLGQWLHETRSENPRQILSLYFRKSLEAALATQTRQKWSGLDGKENPSSHHVSDARQVLAAYADSLYKDLQSYIESRDFETQQKLAKIRQGKAAELKKMRASAPDENKDEVRRANLFMTNETTNDMSEFQTLFTERESYLLEAAENYLVGIREEAAGENTNISYDKRISRLISLWFDNRTNVKLTELMMAWLPKIPSYHFIPVLPQLAARLVSKLNPQLYHDEFPKLLQNLIEKCALEHPHHTLPVILALAMTNKDKEIEETSRSANQHPDEDRVTAAKKLIQKIAKRPEEGVRCKKLEQLHSSLIRLANKEVNVKDRSVDALKIPVELSSMNNLEDVAVPTFSLAVNPDGVYRKDQVVGIISFDPHFILVGGINAPKKMECRGTDGKIRPMLLKGKDDLRQDAVMQQVFSTMNLFLEQDEQTRQRKLNIRTYKVVPLSRRSGLLEWCEGTNPIGFFLLGKDGKSGAHSRYAKPGDLTSEEARKDMANLMNNKSSDERLQRYREICARFPPVFRHFFLEQYSTPSVWFEKRLSYTRSAAASSMVGYILGLGDRHLQNILIDEHTAELIHIDLGIAFDQGTVLPIPEAVPFRLTRDIVDAMGVLGVEGIFRRCCEFSMEVMRKQQDSILTLLEVLLYDPLYVWTVTPQKAAALQQKQKSLSKRRGSNVSEIVADDESVDNEVNESAKRTLVRLSQKLRGVEKGTPLSVRGQVNLLIQQATDPANLYRIFHGWRPQA